MCNLPESHVKQIIEENKLLKEKLSLLEKRIEQLERKLSFYENPHTPPSQRRFPSARPGSHSNGKPGQKEDHEGMTRPQAKSDRTIEVTVKECPHCKSGLRLTSVERKVIENVPRIQQKVVTEFLVSHYHCDHCGREVVPTHPELPQTGRFGKDVIAQATVMKFCDRMTYDKISSALSRHGLDVSSATILDLANRATNAMRPEYESIMRRIRSARVVYADETSIKVNGRNCWIWVFVAGNDVLVVVANSRGKDVIESTLGKDFKGIIGCDGWKPYASFTNRIQRCWAHLLREADNLAEHHEEAAGIAEELHAIFNECKDLLEANPSMKRRRRLWESMSARMERLINMDYRQGPVKKFANKIANGFDYWFTFVLNPGVEPTNNIAERAIREHVVHRKIIGTLRNRKGMFMHETAMSVFQTQQNMGLNPYEELLKVL